MEILNKTNRIDVSVILTSFNSAGTISRCIESIIAATGDARVEVLCVDDASTDNTREIVTEYAHKYSNIKLIRINENSGGPAKPRNTGLKHALGNWIAFCDADDEWLPCRLSRQLLLAVRHGADILSGDIVRVVGEEQWTRAKSKWSENKPAAEKVDILTLDDLLRCNPIALSTVLIKRSLVEKVGQFNEDRQFVAVEDYDYWLRCLFLGALCIRMPSPCVFYNSAAGLSTNKIGMIRKAARVTRKYRTSKKGLYALLSDMVYVGKYVFYALKKRLAMVS